MNFLLHKYNTENQSVKIPNGLNELMSDIGREVLREQPTEIYAFIANYLESMLVVREESQIAERTRTSPFDVGMTISQLMNDTNISLVNAQQTANTIDKAIRQSFERNQHQLNTDMALVYAKDVLQELIDSGHFRQQDLKKLQQIVHVCFKNYYFREKEFVLKWSRLPDNDWVNRVEKTLDFYRKNGPKKWELERAAVVLQAAYRSYYSRKKSKAMQEYEENATKIQSAFKGHLTRKRIAKEKEAATKIQANFRGFKARKNLNVQFQAVHGIQETARRQSRLEKNIKNMDKNTAATKIQAAFKGHAVRMKIDGKFTAVKRISVSGRQSKNGNLHQINTIRSSDNVVPFPSRTSSGTTLLPEGTVINQCSCDGIVYLDQTHVSVASSNMSLL